MVTELGKELRKIRIDNDERLLDMASKLEKSPAFVSAVEIGKKTPPSGFEEAVIQVYGLASDVSERVRQAADRARKAFTILPSTPLGRDTAGLLARRMNDLSEDELESIRAILTKRG